MHIARPFIIAVLALGVSTLNSPAQTPSPPPPPSEDQDKEHRPPPPPLIGALDTDRDGTISAAEISNAPTALLTLDKDKDGKLTKEELRPPRPPQDKQKGNHRERPMRPHKGPRPHGPKDSDGDKPMHRPPPMPLAKALDTDEDRTLSADEIAKSSESLKTLDKNKDGSLTKDEFLPPRPPMPPKDGGADDESNPPPRPDDQ